MRQLLRVWLFAIGFAILFGAVWILAAQFPAAWELSDFNVTFYRVGHYLLRGENVYLNAYPHPYNGREYPPFAPLWVLYVFVPFATLPVPIAEGLRIALDVAMIPFLAYLSARWAGVRQARAGVLLILAPWLLTEVHSGQLTPLVFLGTFLCYWGVRKPSASTTAVGLWLALAKFNLVALILLATFVFARRNKILSRTLLILSGLIGIGSLASPTWMFDVVQMYVERLANPRLADSVLLLPGYPWAQLTLLAVGAMIVLWCVWRWKMDQPTPWLWAVLTASSLVGALHTFVYDWQLLMLPLALLLAERWGTWLTIAIYVYSLLWVVLSAGMDIPIPKVTMIPGIVLVAVGVWGIGSRNILTLGVVQGDEPKG